MATVIGRGIPLPAALRVEVWPRLEYNRRDCRGVAQLAARHVRDVEVGSSSLPTPTIFHSWRVNSVVITVPRRLSTDLDSQVFTILITDLESLLLV